MYARRHGMDGGDVFRLFDEKGVCDFLVDCYDPLHSQGREYILDEIELFMKGASNNVNAWTASTCFAGIHRRDGLHVMITQANIRSILPGKIANVAMILSKRKGISGMDALRMFYCSDVYSKLEREETKYWWQSPEQLSSLIWKREAFSRVASFAKATAAEEHVERVDNPNF